MVRKRPASSNARVKAMRRKLCAKGKDADIRKFEFLGTVAVYPNLWDCGTSFRGRLVEWIVANHEIVRLWLPDILEAGPGFSTSHWKWYMASAVADRHANATRNIPDYSVRVKVAQACVDDMNRKKKEFEELQRGRAQVATFSHMPRESEDAPIPATDHSATEPRADHGSDHVLTEPYFFPRDPKDEVNGSPDVIEVTNLPSVEKTIDKGKAVAEEPAAGDVGVLSDDDDDDDDEWHDNDDNHDDDDYSDLPPAKRTRTRLSMAGPSQWQR
ncbi:hypothetical protein B0T16DRAFT_391501 [Cercophora newfieldiana]|uniref:Uncharacterized protein n=1 Tax=Cercophora newfieldiana TaxID=92897 RepID=A0AA39Y0X8_9PEZI|nr:hypothetical protein B0T16DRAFT_391501 [Cercophora newfieldiana]